jgi:hypothetical protein
MAKSRTSDEAIYKLIRQGVDDARFQLGSALSIIEMRGELSEVVLSRVVRAMNQYEQSQAEFAAQMGSMSSRGQSIIEGDLVDLWKKFWFAMSTISRMANGNLTFYNSLRDLRLRFVIPGGLLEQRAQAAGGR